MKKTNSKKEFRLSGIHVEKIELYSLQLSTIAEKVALVRHRNDVLPICHELEMVGVDIRDRIRQMWSEYCEFEQFFRKRSCKSQVDQTAVGSRSGQK
jgi:hypothetical protein